MEVHHHTHTPGSHQGLRKKWNHYFWEFLMLFLAVFCGFMAENQREHMVEHQREKVFMKSMISDLKADSFTLGIMHKTFSKAVAHIDSLVPLLEEPASMEDHPEKIYQQQVFLNLFFKWVYADRTIDQLKNSGNFRLIRKKNVSDNISTYDGYIRNFIGNMQEAYIQPQWQNLNSAGTRIFKSSVFREFMKGGNLRFEDVPIKLPSQPYFISTEQSQVQQFINVLQQYAVAVEWFNDLTLNAIRLNRNLDSLIKLEYHL